MRLKLSFFVIIITRRKDVPRTVFHCAQRNDPFPMAAPAEAAARGPSKRQASHPAGSLAKIPRKCRPKKPRLTIRNCFLEDPTKLPKYKRVADMIRADADSELISAAKLIDVFSKCGLKLRVDIRKGSAKKHPRTPFVCSVTCGNDYFGKAQHWTKREATARAVQAAWDRFSGAPRFAALAKMVKEGPLEGANVLQKLFTGFLKCRLEVEHKYRTLGGDKKKALHQCIVSCNAEVIGQETAGSRKEAKVRSYEAIWNWLLSYPESP